MSLVEYFQDKVHKLNYLFSYLFILLLLNHIIIYWLFLPLINVGYLFTQGHLKV
jgi:hypothetical protein